MVSASAAKHMLCSAGAWRASQGVARQPILAEHTRLDDNSDSPYY